MFAGSILGIGVYISDPDSYVFGTEVGGFAYKSEFHHVGTSLFLISIFVVGIASYFIKLLNDNIGVATVAIGIMAVILF